MTAAIAEKLESIEDRYYRLNAWGLSCTVDVSGCNPDMIRSDEVIRQYVIEICELIGMTRHGDCLVEHFGDHNEEVAGYSFVQLISTSCITGHFANKTNKAYIDLFSCKCYNPEIVANFTKTYFAAESVRMEYLFR